MKQRWIVIACIMIFIGIEILAYGAMKREANTFTQKPSVSTTETAEKESSVQKSIFLKESASKKNNSVAERSIPLGILCIGDEFLTRSDALNNSYAVILDECLSEEGLQIMVDNQGIGQCSSLSIMRYVGVPEEVLQTYVNVHQETSFLRSASTAQNRFETEIANFPDGILDTGKYEDYLPVLFMGYYGGWNNDPQELVEQQQDVLKALGSRYEDLCIVIGLAPGDALKRSQYEDVMMEAWGDHYISVNQQIENPAASNQGQEEIGKLLSEKIIDIFETIEYKGEK